MPKRKRRRHQAGQTFVLTAIALVVLLGFTGMAVDVGYLHQQKGRIQAAADAAAIAGASQLLYGTGTAAAKRDAALNGFIDGAAHTTVTVNNPPASGPNSANSSYVEVLVSQPQATFFLGALGKSSVTVAARAVASDSSAPNCGYSLNPSASGAVSIDPSNLLTMNCGLMVNSSSSTAITSSGTLTATQVGIVGGYSGTINSSNIRTGILPVNDPLAYLQPPAVGGCSQTKYKKSSGSAALSPGVYCGGITLSGSANVTLNAGTYILAGGGLSVTGNAKLTGTGVTFYNTKNGSYAYAPIFTQDQAVLVLKAPTSGAYSGILFFQDRSISSNAQNIIGADGGGAGVGGLEGTLYFPTTPLVFSSGQADTVNYTIVVADTISVGVDKIKFNNNYSSLANGSPIKATVLAE